MSAFTRLLRPALLSAAASPRVERTVTNMRATRSMVDRFVAGTTEADALTAVTALLDSGRWVTVDYLGEYTTDPAQARDTVERYQRLVAALAELPAAWLPGNVRPVEVSMKLSALGQSLPADGHRIALDHAREICATATDAGIAVTVDAEDHTTTDSTLAIVRELRAEFPSVGTVLQAYLRRTENDCREFAGPGSRIRLCKGAYREPAAVAFQRSSEVDDSYRRCLRVLMSGSGYPMVATHDPAMIAAAATYADECQRGPGDFEFQMLYGIREAEQARLVAAGHRMRVYLPYGERWYGYFMRRLAERPANLAFFLRALTSRERV
ncbi:MAG TPA: proline dehydrogenase family protein [Nocardia sp.]|uniref:proline dehydrogenase family protein n=1 Tax=Nocardia TaxID=1817 RepID=UPI0024560496|nr:MULTISPECIES: proline dehydrogenase family protein [Nocardia]HLS75562.1 proline dehydrogenase family protein [Nocardia sp.]